MTSEAPNNTIYDITIRLFFLIIIVAWCLMIMLPFASIILWSVILAMAMYPLHNSLSKKLGNSPKLASSIIIISFLAIVLIPTGLLIGSLIEEVKTVKSLYDSGALTIPPPTEKVKEWPIIGSALYEFWLNASENLQNLILKYQDQLIAVGSKVGKGILGAIGGVVQILISLIIAGVFRLFGGLGNETRNVIRKLDGNRVHEFADMILKTVSSVVKGVMGVALVLALLNGVLFMLAGIPYAGIWTLICFILAVLQLPLFFVTLPIIAYMFATKEFVPAAIWTVLLFVAGLSDNVLKPILLGKGAPVPMLVIFIGVIGGFILSGFIGLFTGAIVMSIGYKLFLGWVDSSDLELQE